MFNGKKSKNIIPPEVLEQFDEFKEKFNSSSLSAEALAEQMENVDQRIVNYAKTCKNGEMTTEGFKSSVEGISLKAKAAAIGVNILKTALNTLAAIGISMVINAIITGIDNLVNRVAKIKEAANEAKSTTFLCII